LEKRGEKKGAAKERAGFNKKRTVFATGDKRWVSRKMLKKTKIKPDPGGGKRSKGIPVKGKSQFKTEDQNDQLL